MEGAVGTGTSEEVVPGEVHGQHTPRRQTNPVSSRLGCGTGVGGVDACGGARWRKM